MTPKRDDFLSGNQSDTQIVKIENDQADKTRAVLDITGKKKIGEAS
jgi:hypothetical protein